MCVLQLPHYALRSVITNSTHTLNCNQKLAKASSRSVEAQPPSKMVVRYSVFELAERASNGRGSVQANVLSFWRLHAADQSSTLEDVWTCIQHALMHPQVGIPWDIRQPYLTTANLTTTPSSSSIQSSPYTEMRPSHPFFRLHHRHCQQHRG